MAETTKKTFTAHLAELITPERFIWVISIFFGMTLATGYNLLQASNSIAENAKKNVEQDATLDELDDTQRQYALDINSLKINQEQIKDLIRGISD